ncbi:MAG: hypothetical protein ACLRVT_05250 [Oscillospiraceae bacterium]
MDPDTIGAVYNFITSAPPTPWESLILLYHLPSGRTTPLPLKGGCLGVFPQENASLLAVTAPFPQQAGQLSLLTLEPSGEILSQMTCLLPKPEMNLQVQGGLLLQDGMLYGFGAPTPTADRELLLYAFESSTGKLTGWERIQKAQEMPCSVRFADTPQS